MKIRQQEGGCMKKFIENIIIIMVLTVVILFSYAVMEKKISGKSADKRNKENMNRKMLQKHTHHSYRRKSEPLFLLLTKKKSTKI